MIKGFFDIKQDPKPSKKDNSQKTKDCEGCGLYSNCHSPKIQYSGQGKKGIFELGEAPGETEDLQGTQFVGKAGQKFRDTLSRFGLDLDRDFWKDNCLGCRPHDGNKNREPKMFEMKCCASRWQNALRETRPKVVWLMGQKPLEAYFMDRLDIDPDDREGKSGINIGSWRRHAIPDYKNNCWVIPMYHPSFILRNENEKYGIAQTVFERDIRWAMTYVNKELPVKPEAKTICLYKKDEIVSLLKQVLEDKRHLIFDYETTGLKPYTNGHRIVSASFRGIQEESAYSFPLGYALHFNHFEYKEIEGLWKQILEDCDILKVAHNMKFEEKWSYVILKTRVNGWDWDTMQAEHLLDSRPGITGLKICSFLRWGIDNWGTEIEPYMKEKDGMEFNTIDKCPLDKLLKYGGDDSYWETELYLAQQKQFKAMPSLQKCYDELFHPGALVLEESEDIGVCVDIPYYETTKKTIVDSIALIQTELDESEEAKKFKEVTGKDLLWSSNKDLNTLFFDILKVQPLRETKSGYAVDEKSLASFNVPISEKMVAQRKLKKIGTTYIDSYIKNAVEGLIHADITLHIAASGRSSCTNPNLQNVIKRNPESMYMIRKGVVPLKKGHRIMAADYSQAEVRVMACYSKDPVLINYILDPLTDMHRDQAMAIFRLEQDEVSKPLRHIGKNSFVFPQFYGDWWAANATSIWEEAQGKKTTSGIDIIKHLRSKGIKELGTLDKKNNPSKGSLYEHVREVERNFWDLLKVTKEWREKAVRDYLQKGYSDSFTGYRRSGFLDQKQICNTCVQGVAFHCLLWSYIRVAEIIKEEGLESRLLFEVHDELIASVPDNEVSHMAKIIRRVMVDEIGEWAKSWLIVPMETEISTSELKENGGNWAEMKELKENN